MADNIRVKEEKIQAIQKLLNILNESTVNFTNKLFNGNQETRRQYCDNLYELEKCLKKFYELENIRYAKERSKQGNLADGAQAGAKRPPPGNRLDQ